MAAESGIHPDEYRHWAMCQIHYALGDTGFSYVIGYGDQGWPQRPHHRSRSVTVCFALSLFCIFSRVQCCFTSNIRTVRDWEPRTSTSIYTQLLKSRPCSFQFSSSVFQLPSYRSYGLLGKGSPGRPLRLTHCSRALFLSVFFFSVALRSYRSYVRDC